MLPPPLGLGAGECQGCLWGDFLEEIEGGPGAWWGWRKKGEDREGGGSKVSIQGAGWGEGREASRGA